MAFEAMNAATVNISVGAGSANVLVENFSGCNCVRVFNDGTATAWIDFGGSTVAATLAASIPIATKTSHIFAVPASSASTVYAAAIAAGATGSIYFTPGNGS